jgi:hypothetical protein
MTPLFHTKNTAALRKMSKKEKNFSVTKVLSCCYSKENGRNEFLLWPVEESGHEKTPHLSIFLESDNNSIS